jgi:hypothetical protein
METFLGFLSLLSICWFVAGLVSPSKALFWVKKRTRWRVFGWFVLFTFVIGTAIQIFVPKPPQSEPGQAATTLNREAVEQAAAEAEEGRKQAEANREKIVKQTEASIAELAAKQEAAKPDAAQVVQQAREEIKTKVRAFEKELLGYDAISSMYMENAKAMTRQLGKGAGLGDLYTALKQARQYAQAGANAVLQLRVPDGLPEPATASLKDAKEASWQMMLGRRDALEAFMDWVDNRKPSAQAKLQEQSNFSALQAARTVECLLHAKTAAGFTEDEIKTDLNVQGDDQTQEKPAKSKKRK